MTLDKDQISSKIWNLCNILLDDGVSASDYLQQITFIIFLKMAYERTRPPYNQESPIPEKYNWESLIKLDGDDLEIHYRNTLDTLAKYDGILGMIFRKAQNKISDPAKLKRVISEIGKVEWTLLGVDVKGEIYESLLARVAEDVKSGAGQYFTPRVLIRAMVEVMRPSIHTTIHDPCAGTGGFLLEAHDYILEHGKLDRDEQRKLKKDIISGQELVAETARLAVMNMFLHGIGETKSPISVGDSLIKDPGLRYKIILTNPPFGTKSTHKFTTEDGKEEKGDNKIERSDFWATTSNKQLNFIQHIHTLLEVGGRAAIVLPDNVLFEGGAGEIIRKKILHNCNLHTILRLPTGIFYANGVKANVLFLEKKTSGEEGHTKSVWFYDLRTNIHFSLKQNPLKDSDLSEFIQCYNPENIADRKELYSTENPDGRWRKYSIEEIMKRDKTNLDIFWIKDKALEESENLPDPEIIAEEIIEDLENALEQFRLIEKEINR
ncbi:MAG: class I SAM-dependent DNA methyltransferase [Candidatus Altimarinota bacterium]